jgi:hypothetical protein
MKEEDKEEENEGLQKKNLLSFFQHQEKFGRILFYKEDHKLGRAKTTIKEKKKKGGKNCCKIKLVELLLALREVWEVCFLQRRLVGEEFCKRKTR